MLTNDITAIDLRQLEPAAFDRLEVQARHACVTVNPVRLPPGCTPPTARIGFEVDPVTRVTTLFVQHGISSTSPDPELVTWLTTGSRRFPSFADLRVWLADRGMAAHPVPVPSLIDLDLVHAALAPPRVPAQVDAEVLAGYLRREIRGQDQAIETLARQLSRHLARQHPRRPLSLFAIGPTGVGKTRTAEHLPQAIAAAGGNGYGMLRLDMAEYAESHRVSQLLGAPPGYVGYGDGARLADALAAQPRTVVLFDEIEKAHPVILRTLMNALDAGRLSTPSATADGREIDCREAIFFFTSNLAPGEIVTEIERRQAFQDQAIIDDVARAQMVRTGLLPELVGRIRVFLLYQPLTVEARAEIVALGVGRVAREYGMTIGRIAPSVVVSIMQRQARGRFGARTDEYMVDDMLGDLFVQAARDGIAGPIEIMAGPPIHCVPMPDDTSLVPMPDDTAPIPMAPSS